MEWVKDPIPFLKESNLFVLSSDYEGFKVVITEAFSVRVNVVSTDFQSALREILNNGELVYLCEVDNPRDLTESIKKPWINQLIERS
jgi:glycosyltransferase involved in cell wall biosynthesis